MLRPAWHRRQSRPHRSCRRMHEAGSSCVLPHSGHHGFVSIQCWSDTIDRRCSKRKISKDPSKGDAAGRDAAPASLHARGWHPDCNVGIREIRYALVRLGVLSRRDSSGHTGFWWHRRHRRRNCQDPIFHISGSLLDQPVYRQTRSLANSDVLGRAEAGEIHVDRLLRWVPRLSCTVGNTLRL
jgi:hypothetical protein